MAKVSVFIYVAVVLVVILNSSTGVVSRYLRPTAEENAAMPCTMHHQNSSISSSDGTDHGSLQEADTISIGSKVFNIVDVDNGNTMSIGNKVFNVVDTAGDTMSIGNTKLKISA
ncbi:uncharacterized protein IUM83_10967 [Phytophthora cinnamomi]|uniref:uncharacterized protein n=1 Tax=Phytophthora cinnamomi TaxID=4785 RepID=UPI0035597455|nr:hypothetical protein IUM83_10967 [Phytophthora cinnamomi]